MRIIFPIGYIQQCHAISYGCNNFNDWAKYACNDSYYGDQIIVAIFVTKRIKYACNVVSKGNRICLQSLSIGTKYAWDSNGLQAYMVRFVSEITSIFSPFCDHNFKHLVLFVEKIATIFGPNHKNYCKHMWYMMYRTSL